MEWLDALDRFLEHQGAFKGFLILTVIFLAALYHWQSEKRIADKEREIKRLAADVHEMRDRLMALWDDRRARKNGVELAVKERADG